jgi:hypothetical protein
MTYDSRAKSEKSLRGDSNRKEDIFTSMRNILKEDAPESLLTSKNNNADLPPQKNKENS